MQTSDDHERWAEEEFGRARVGDLRRTRRLVAVAAAAAARPAGRITQVMDEPAAREATFRLMANEAATPDAVARSAHEACAARAAGQPFVFVPVDGSSLNLTDLAGRKDLGVVGARSIGARGLQVMTAIAVAPDGTPLGICGQRWWARKRRARRKKRDRRAVRSKETQYWLDTMQDVREVFAARAPSVRPWFQLDRGGDAWPVLLDGLLPEQLFTVRAAHDRRLWTNKDEPRRRLWEKLEAQPLLGRYEFAVPSRPGRAARTATMEVRACEVTFEFSPPGKACRYRATLWAVLACEAHSAPSDKEAIEWLLLTTHPIGAMADAQLVLRGYGQRWRIEEFHRLWKSGACNVEEMQLRDREAILRWATILASVAMRLLRLTYLARTQPTLPASVELTQAEIDAVIVSRKPRGYHRGDTPPITLVVRWLADAGGYTGKSSGGPPGAVVIRRGLERMRSLADYFASGEM
jgi:hypothetical protein